MWLLHLSTDAYSKAVLASDHAIVIDAVDRRLATHA